MSYISFFVPGPPQGKGRPRATSIGGKPRMYTPKKTEVYEALIAMLAKGAMVGRHIFDEPMKVEIGINHAIPKSWTKEKKSQAMSDRIRPASKPDIDNVVKAIFDGMNGVVWTDDVLVSELTVMRMYSDEPGVKVIAGPLGG